MGLDMQLRATAGHGRPCHFCACLIVPRQPCGWVESNGGDIALDDGQVVPGIGAVKLGGVNDRHVDVAQISTMLGTEEERISSMQDRRFNARSAMLFSSGTPAFRVNNVNFFHRLSM